MCSCTAPMTLTGLTFLKGDAGLVAIRSRPCLTRSLVVYDLLAVLQRTVSVLLGCSRRRWCTGFKMSKLVVLSISIRAWWWITIRLWDKNGKPSITGEQSPGAMIVWTVFEDHQQFRLYSCSLTYSVNFITTSFYQSASRVQHLPALATIGSRCWWVPHESRLCENCGQSDVKKSEGETWGSTDGTSPEEMGYTEQCSVCLKCRYDAVGGVTATIAVEPLTDSTTC